MACLLAAALCLAAACAAHADVFGRLRVVVHDEADRPIPSAVVTFHDPAGVRADLKDKTDAEGIVLSPPLEIRPWSVTTEVVTFNTDTRTVPVVADTSTEVDVRLTKRILTRTGGTVIVGRNQTADQTRINPRGPRQLNTIGNPQSLRNLLITTPGINLRLQRPGPSARRSLQHVHLRLRRQAAAGVPGPASGQVLLPDIIQSIDVQTGGYSPGVRRRDRRHPERRAALRHDHPVPVPLAGRRRAFHF